MSLDALRTRSAWLVFAFIFLLMSKPFRAQSKPPEPVSVCQPMFRDGPPMCLEAVDATPLDRRIPLLLVHGWNRDRPGMPGPEVWNNFIDYAAVMPWVGEKFKLYQVTYYSNLVSVPDISRILASLVDDMDALDRDFAQQKIFLVGHSMGGLVARSFMQEWRLQGGRGGAGGERVLRLVTLATPHHGAPFANGPMRDDKASTLGSYVLDLIDGLLFRNMPWSEYNRFDLHADKELSSLIGFDYSRFIGDQNIWLDHLNADNPYRQKVSAYGGSIRTWDTWSAGCPILDGLARESEAELLDCSALLMNGLYNTLWNDGIVPDFSAGFPSCDLCTTETFFGYNHFQMVQGQSPYDSYLFGAVMSDLSDFVITGDSRFGSLVILGNPGSEAFHNIRGWSATVGQDSTRTVFRNQLNEQQSYVDLFVPRSGVPYLLSFKRGGNTCGDDRFNVYITINGTDVPTQLFDPSVLQCRFNQGASIYQFRIPDYAVKKNKIRVGFYGWSNESNPRLAPMYYIRLDPV